MKVKAFSVCNNTMLAQLPAAIQAMDGGELIGGYSWVGNIGVWNALLIVSTPAQLDAFDAAAGAGYVELVRMVDDARSELEVNISPAVLTKLNNWLTARGFPTETTASSRVIIRKLFRRFLGSFELEKIDVN